MTIPIFDSIEVDGSFPIDSRSVQATINDALNNISINNRYIGLTVFIQNIKKEYIFKDGISNANFVEKLVDLSEDSDIPTNTFAGIKKLDITSSSDILANQDVIVPRFKVNANNLFIFKEGKLIYKDEDYFEVGPPNISSNAIRFYNTIDANTRLYAVSFALDRDAIGEGGDDDSGMVLPPWGEGLGTPEDPVIVDYWITKAGNDGNDGKHPDRPFLTVARANQELAQFGGWAVITFHFGEGLWREGSINYGIVSTYVGLSPTAKLIFLGSPNYTTTIDNSTYLINVDTVNIEFKNINIYSINILNSGNNPNSDIIFTNVKFLDTTNSGLTYKIQISDKLLIHFNGVEFSTLVANRTYLINSVQAPSKVYITGIFAANTGLTYKVTYAFVFVSCLLEINNAIIRSDDIQITNLFVIQTSGSNSSITNITNSDLLINSNTTNIFSINGVAADTTQFTIDNCNIHVNIINALNYIFFLNTYVLFKLLNSLSITITGLKTIEAFIGFAISSSTNNIVIHYQNNSNDLNIVDIPLRGIYCQTSTPSANYYKIYTYGTSSSEIPGISPFMPSTLTISS